MVSESSRQKRHHVQRKTESVWGRKAEILQGMIGTLFCKDLSRSNGRAFKYALMGSALF